MHHLYPASKGDPLCPLGFHPQVRWPTRCKRCFRDYKEHGGRNKDQEGPLRKDDNTASTPSLGKWASPSSRFRDDSNRSSTESSGYSSRNSWTTSTSSSSSSQSDNTSSSSDNNTSSNSVTTRLTGKPSSWTSTPDLGNLTDDTKSDVTTFSFTLPRRKPVPADTGQKKDIVSAAPSPTPNDYSLRRRTTDLSHLSNVVDKNTTVSRQKSPTPSGKDTGAGKLRRVKIQSLKEVHSIEEPTNPEVEFIIQVKSSKKNNQLKEDGKSLSFPKDKASSTYSEESQTDESDDDTFSTAGTETTDTTLIDRNDNMLQEEIDSLKQELDSLRIKCERLEREKSDLLLRRIASIDMAPSKSAASEVLKLQQKVNEMQSQLEDLKDDKKSLSLRVKELQSELDARPDKTATQRTIDELRSKLLAAETLCEELMDENEDMKKELRDLEEEIEEMQDNFREDQADEYTSLKKELEQTAKNCRILSFKLRKAERKSEQLEAEKLDLEKKCRDMVGGQSGMDKAERIRHLEQELGMSNEVAKRLQKDLDEANEKLKLKETTNIKEDLTKKRPPMLSAIGKVASGEKVSRESLTRGGSQEDPAVLLRDLQDAMEREADLREQLRFAEEEAQMLRKKSSRVEDDNESLVLQLKKMATKARSRKHSPSPARLTPEPSMEKDEGISDEDDPAELRLLLELNEQEAAVLRRKVEEMEKEGETMKKKMKDLQDKLNSKQTKHNALATLNVPTKGDPLVEQKIKVLETELTEVRKKLIEKERDCERLHAELTLVQKRPKIQKSKSLEGVTDQQNLDLKRQLQVVEQEASILRNKTQSLEAENEKLSAENKKLQLLQVTKKGGVDISKDVSKVKEFNEKITSLETQLTEANNKVNELKGKLEEKESSSLDMKKLGAKDGDLVKLKKEVKTKSDELEKLKTEMNKITTENDKLGQELKRIKDESVSNLVKFYKQRTPKKPTDLTTKLQMKKMVEELENEIGEILVALKKADDRDKNQANLSENQLQQKTMKEKYEKEIDSLEKRMADLENDLAEERSKLDKEKKKALKERKNVEEGRKKAEEDKQKLEDEKKEWTLEKKKIEDLRVKTEQEKAKFQSENDKLLQEKKKLEEQVVKLNADKVSAGVKQSEINEHVNKIQALKVELEEEKKKGDELKTQLEAIQKGEQEKIKLQKELNEKNSKLSESEKKLKEAEEKIKKTERMLLTNKNKNAKLEKELEEQYEKAKATETTQKEVAAGWLIERDGLKEQLTVLQSKIDSLESTLSTKTTLIQQLEETAKERDNSARTGSEDKVLIASLKDEIVANKAKLEELTKKLETTERNVKSSDEKFKKLETDLKKENKLLESKASEFENDLQAERKKMERMKAAHEKELKNRDQELSSLKSKLKSLEDGNGSNNKKIQEIRKEYQDKINKLEDQLAGEKQEYDDLTTKYEILEEEHVVTKAQLVMEKETIQGQLLSTKREMANIETELKTLRETYNTKQDTWIKEKLDFQEKVREMEEKISRNDGDLEKTRLKASIENKNVEIEQVKKEGKNILDQMEHLRKENEEMRRQLDDYERVSKIQRNITADTTAIDKELRETKNKLLQEEKAHKSEIAQLKMRYDNRMAIIGDEIHSLQAQVTRFKREKDTFKHMLESAQKTIADLKASPKKPREHKSSTSADESEDTRMKIASLEQQVSCMEDELSDARLESSKLKTELVSERSSWEIKLAELQSRINELEEERIISSGRTKIAGMKTRMELAWHKEREEQHRLLQETSTLARDLRQTLFEVERERDKERLESKRKLDQLKKSIEEEQEENRKKVVELQCDLLELRDAHAKLRTTNEKLRREKERNEKEREELRQIVSGKRRAEQEDERKLNMLLEQVEDLMRLAPDLFSQKQKASTTTNSAEASVTTPTPPRRLKGPKSRESSPALERKEFKKESSVDRKVQLQSAVQKLSDVTEELRKYQKLGEEEKERERAKRMLGFRRAASTESENAADDRLHKKSSSNSTKGIQKRGSLYRKSLSLEQTSAVPEQQSIWTTDDETDGSMSSLQSIDDRRYSSMQRESSMDSRLSGGSTKSDTGDKKKKKGLFGKLKKLTKSRSIDETTSAFPYTGSNQGSASDVSMGEPEDRGSKKDLRDRLTGMFKKGGSRSNSLERGKSPSKSDQKLSSKTSGSSSTLPRPSPARSDSSQTSSVARPLSPGVLKTPSSSSNRASPYRGK